MNLPASAAAAAETGQPLTISVASGVPDALDRLAGEERQHGAGIVEAVMRLMRRKRRGGGEGEQGHGQAQGLHSASFLIGGASA